MKIQKAIEKLRKGIFGGKKFAAFQVENTTVATDSSTIVITNEPIYCKLDDSDRTHRIATKMNVVFEKMGEPLFFETMNIQRLINALNAARGFNKNEFAVSMRIYQFDGDHHAIEFSTQNSSVLSIPLDKTVMNYKDEHPSIVQRWGETFANVDFFLDAGAGI